MNVRSFPDSLSLVGNMRHLVVETTEDVSFSIRIQGASTDIVKRVFSPNSDHIMEVDLFDIVSPELSFSLQNESSPYRQTDIVKTFVITLKGVSSNQTQTVTFTALRGGVDRLADTAELFLQQNFLTWQPNLKPVTYYTPEFLTYYATVASMVKCKARIGGSDTTVTLASIPAGQAWTIPVQYAVIAGKVAGLPSYYDVWVENGNGDRLTYVQRYYAQDMRSEDEQWILFENSLGGVDTFRAYGSTEMTADHSHNIAEIEDVAEEFRVDTIRKYKKNTGRLDRKERLWLLDFFPSLVKYVYAGDYLRRIVVTDSDVNYKASELPSQYNFTYKYADAKPYLNIPRADAPLEVLDIDIPEVGSFTVAPRLAEFPRIQLSSGALFPVQDPYGSSWAATTLGAIAQFFIQYIIGSYPGGGGIGHTHSNFDFLEDLSWDKLLRKDTDDTAAGVITFLRGFIARAKSYLKGIENDGDISNTGTIYTKNLLVTGKASFMSVEIEEVKAAGGMIVESPGRFRIDRVEQNGVGRVPRTAFNKHTGNTDRVIRCFQLAKDERDRMVFNEIRPGDQLLCLTFNIDPDNAENATANRYYWRRVLAVSSETEILSEEDGGSNPYHWVDVSLDDFDGSFQMVDGVLVAMSDGATVKADVPEAGDETVVLGHNWGDETDRDRQGAWVSSAYKGNDPQLASHAPYKAQYWGIDDYDLSSHLKTYFARGDNRVVGTMEMTADSTLAGERVSDTLRGLRNQVNSVKSQTDKQMVIWLGEGVPTMGNEPASDWQDESTRELHEHDLYYNKSQASADGSGRAWSWEKVDGAWTWKEITDKDVLRALEVAAQAQESADAAQQSADEKCKTFIVAEPNVLPAPPYKVGDLWMNASYAWEVDDVENKYDNDLLRCVVAKGKDDQPAITDWAPAHKATSSELKTLDDKIMARVTSEDFDRFRFESGLVVTDISGLMYTLSRDSKGTVVTSEISTYVRQEVIDGKTYIKSGISLRADQIDFIGKTVINGKFVVDNNGNVTMDHFTATNASITGVINAKYGTFEQGLLSTNNMVGLCDTPRGTYNWRGLAVGYDVRGIGDSDLANIGARFPSQSAGGAYGRIAISSQSAGYVPVIELSGLDGSVNSSFLRTNTVYYKGCVTGFAEVRDSLTLTKTHFFIRVLEAGKTITLPSSADNGQMYIIVPHSGCTLKVGDNSGHSMIRPDGDVVYSMSINGAKYHFATFDATRGEWMLAWTS